MAASAPPCSSGERTSVISCCRMFPPLSWPSEAGCVTASVDRKLSAICDTCMSLSEMSGGSSASTASTMTGVTASLRGHRDGSQVGGEWAEPAAGEPPTCSS